MPWLMATIYDRFMAETEAACLGQWRAELLTHAAGRVLEVGAGTGANLPHYSSAVDKLVVSEPDTHMRARLLKKDALPKHAEVTGYAVGSGDLATESFDTVVCTLVLCSVAQQDAALADLHRVLAPGGKLLFMEHVAAENNPKRLRLQRRIEPFWRRLADNCHVTRDTEDAIQRAGFSIDEIQRESMRRALPWIRPTVRGVAVRT